METKEILKKAKAKGLCKEWQTDFNKDSSLKHLCEKFFEGSDWALENDFPDLELLRKFPTDPYGLHTDCKGGAFEVSNEKGELAFFGDSEAEINLKGYSVSEIYVRHNSNVKITAYENAYAVVTILDNAFVEIESKDRANVSVYQYGNNSNFRITGNVTVKESKWAK